MMILLLLGALLSFQVVVVTTIKVAENYWTLQPNVLVVEVDVERFGRLVQVPLSCGEAFDGQNIIWRKNAKEEPMGHGNKVNVTVEERQGANYTCYTPEDSPLNHTLVLVQWPRRKIIKERPGGGHIQCSAKNYSGSFNCSWVWDENRSGYVALITVTRSDSTANLSCTLDSSGHGIACVDQDHCPYAEETKHIRLTVHARSSYLLESYAQQFYINDIVKPDQVGVEWLNRSVLGLSYPVSWSTPSSYFPLTFQVKEIRCRRGCSCEGPHHKATKVYTTQSCQLPARKGVAFCVRAQDALCDSSWSDWQLYKHKRRTKVGRGDGLKQRGRARVGRRRTDR